MTLLPKRNHTLAAMAPIYEYDEKLCASLVKMNTPNIRTEPQCPQKARGLLEVIRNKFLRSQDSKKEEKETTKQAGEPLVFKNYYADLSAFDFKVINNTNPENQCEGTEIEMKVHYLSMLHRYEAGRATIMALRKRSSITTNLYDTLDSGQEDSLGSYYSFTNTSDFVDEKATSADEDKEKDKSTFWHKHKNSIITAGVSGLVGAVAGILLYRSFTHKFG